MNFNQVSGKNVTLMILKVTKNKALHSLQAAYILKYIFRANVCVLFEWNFNICFCQISNLSFCLNKNELSELTVGYLLEFCRVLQYSIQALCNKVELMLETVVENCCIELCSECERAPTSDSERDRSI